MNLTDKIAILLTKPYCPQCIAVKLFLTNHGVPFTTYDVSKNEDVIGYLKENRILQLPILQYKGETIIGNNVAKLEKLILKD